MPSLDRKWRPKTFRQVIGNEEIKTAIQSLLNDIDSFPSAILLQGPSGCGKTTLARIISRQLEVERQSIYELNIANSRKIDDARAIIENLNFNPIIGKGKVIVLNECHKAINEFQNAILEVLEEPPKNTFFILCTTNPELLQVTIKTRCSIFTVRKLDQIESETLIKKILRRERKKLNESIIRSIISYSEGTPRIILNILNVVLKTKDKKEQKKIIANFITSENEKVIELCRMLMKPKPNYKEVMQLANKLDEDPEHIRRIILKYMSKVIVNKNNPKAALIINNFWDNYFSTGKAGLLLSVYNTIVEEE